MAEVLIDSYPESNAVALQDSFGNEPGVADVQVSQSLTGTGVDISRAQFYLRKVGNPTGYIVAKIYAHTGTYGTSSLPTGPALATSDTFNTAELSTSNSLVSFYFTGSNRINLTNGTRYVLVLDGTNSAHGGSDGAYISYDNTSPTHGGNAGYYNGTTWSTFAADWIFYLYGESKPTVSTSTPSSIGSIKATGNGSIVGIGSASPTIRGFVYGRESFANPGNVAPASCDYSDYVSESGTFSTGSFTLKLSGLIPETTHYVRAFAYNSNGYAYGDEVSFTTNSLTVATFTNTDPTVIFREILDNSNVLGSRIVYDGSSTELTGESIDYRFNMNTILDGINICLNAAPAGWYWYVDLGTRIAYFKNTESTATHKFIRNKHLKSISVAYSIEKLINTVYFTGGELVSGFNLFKLYTDADSIAEYGQRLERRIDNRVTVTATADAMGGRVIAESKDEAYFMRLEILDNDYDITLLKPGDTVSVGGYGNFIDNILLQITRVKYTPSMAIVNLGTMPTRLTPSIEQVKRDLIAVQTVANPDSPS